MKDDATSEIEAKIKEEKSAQRLVKKLKVSSVAIECKI